MVIYELAHQDDNVKSVWGCARVGGVPVCGCAHVGGCPCGGVPRWGVPMWGCAHVEVCPHGHGSISIILWDERDVRAQVCMRQLSTKV